MKNSGQGLSAVSGGAGRSLWAPWMRHIPNILTILRLAGIPFVLYLLTTDDKMRSLIAWLIYAAAALTDLFDGYLARRMGIITMTGKLLDPLADKLLISLSLIMLIPLNRVPAWVVAVIIGREIAITGLRSMAISDGIHIASTRTGKYKLSFQACAVGALILHYSYGGVNFHRAGMVLLWIALFMTVWSGMDYFWKYFTTASQGGR